MPLPKEKSKPKTDLLDYSILLYGPTKVGKTTFASHAEAVLFMATEPGTSALSVYEVQIAKWAQLLEACRDVAKGGHEFKSIVIDTVDNAYQMCVEHVCAENGWKHPSDADYGKGFAVVNNEFKRVLLGLARLPYGLFLISHSQEKEIKSRTGNYTRITTTLPESARKIVIGLMDLVLYCEVEAVQTEEGYEYPRVIRTKPTPNYDAGDRTGRLPEVLPLDFKAFMSHFYKATNPPKKDKAK